MGVPCSGGPKKSLTICRWAQEESFVLCANMMLDQPNFVNPGLEGTTNTMHEIASLDGAEHRQVNIVKAHNVKLDFLKKRPVDPSCGSADSHIERCDFKRSRVQDLLGRGPLPSCHCFSTSQVAPIALPAASVYCMRVVIDLVPTRCCRESKTTSKVGLQHHENFKEGARQI